MQSLRKRAARVPEQFLLPSSFLLSAHSDPDRLSPEEMHRSRCLHAFVLGGQLHYRAQTRAQSCVPLLPSSLIERMARAETIGEPHAGLILLSRSA